MYSGRETPPYRDKTLPEAGKAATASRPSSRRKPLRQGPTCSESELIKLRVSQLKGCLFCLYLHCRQSRHAGVAHRSSSYTGVARRVSLQRAGSIRALDNRAATQLPLNENSKAEPVAAHSLLGDGTLVAAWVAAAINTFNRTTILTEHQDAPP